MKITSKKRKNQIIKEIKDNSEIPTSDLINKFPDIKDYLPLHIKGHNIEMDIYLNLHSDTIIKTYYTSMSITSSLVDGKFITDKPLIKWIEF